MPSNTDQRALRVLVADDSAVMRSAMRTLFKLHAEDETSGLPKMELCGLAENGAVCLEAVRQLQPDVLLLDFEMPVLNGLEVLARLQIEAPMLPVIMCSAYTERGARATLDALARGAKDYVMKPSQQNDFAAALDTLMQQLLPRIAAIARRRVTEVTPQEIAATSRVLPPAMALDGKTPALTARVEIVVIAVSTGGPAALEQLLPMLPHDLRVPVMIVQHMPRLYTGALAKRLNGLCALTVVEAAAGVPVKAGCVYLAPGDAHMEVLLARRELSSATVHLHQGAPLNSCMPSADYLFRSAAGAYGPGTLALVMTGMGADGMDGAREVQTVGGAVLAQDAASSAVWGMPGRVSRAGIARATLPLDQLAGEITRLVNLSVSAGTERSLVPRIVAREELYGVL